MSHSHVPVKHLLKQLEAQRANRRSRDIRPDWLRQFVDQAAQLFEPDRDVARVGFRCKLEEESWVIELFVGKTEIVGGPDDGRNVQTPYHLDVNQLCKLFAGETQVTWRVSPAADEATSSTRLQIAGQIEQENVRLHILSTPPTELGPGMQQLPDGTIKPV